MTTVKLMVVAIIICPAFTVVAQTWTQTSAPTNDWQSVALSTDGSKLAAASSTLNSGGIYTSTNSGNIWISHDIPVSRFNSVASSADGTKLVRGGYPVYVSTDSGNTWTQTLLPTNSYWVTSSADGTKLVAASGGINFPGSIYSSSDSGNSWTQTSAPTNQWSALASSADGNMLVAAAGGYVGGGPIYTSTNSGNTWITNCLFVSVFFNSVASSADGRKLVVVASTNIFTSTNSGNSWTTNYVPNHSWTSVASSADGSRLVAAANNVILTSTNSGNTWTSNNVPNKSWIAVASSADGAKLVAVVDNGGIWTLQTTPAPVLNITAANTNLTLSWIIPSTNFVLWQCTDLAAGDWSVVTNPPVLNLTNLQNQVTLPPPAGNAFFQLYTP